ncbi:F-box/FBD/LRR-repeat protein At1g13570-like isoform X2 [Magnolia sinica]|uniref:F-box/FBD/LRR-repeat protein At1g13570-like isoform X2 n=1 Tax=Magnolia sinica TaxID=86752 RepID=UPI00265A29F8|nr:F-box/FBD/LRR-repeat protein At1g13570-like isoform X2 [Magnolia sinica]XP_058115019.1 F-box/FBD/LRR-repeat protein At1g13570-like isoform X2 [Magnolia sinica]
MEASNPQHMMEMDRVQFRNLDMISHLPPNVIDVILMCLPLRDAVRTSILSRNWRYKWATIPHLTFDKRSVPSSVDDYSDLDELELVNSKLVNAIDQVLLLHRGPVHEFKCQNYLESCPAIDRWILLLSGHGVKSFTLDLLPGEQYKVPSCLFHYKNLIQLKLSRCIFKPPSKFEGFPSLKILHLQNVTIDNSFEDLISKFPFLVALTLREFDGLTRLKIRGPKLLFFDISGKLKYLCFENIPLVATARIQMTSSNNYKKSKESNLIKVLGWLHGVKRLSLEGFLLQFLAAGYVPKRLPTTYNCLKNLTLTINFLNLDDLLVALCLCRSSPNLHELCIMAHSMSATRTPDESFWEVQEHLDGLFANLRIVTVTNVSGFGEMDFVEYVLANALLLEKMNIMINEMMAREKASIFQQLMGFQRASSQARIIFLGLNKK